jgi:catecholate siderophore receptor
MTNAVHAGDARLCAFRMCLLLTSAIVAGAGVLLPVHAQDASKDEASQAVEKVTVTGKRNYYKQDDTASATKTNTKMLDVPQSVTAITRDLIEDQDMRSMGDVTRYVPGVSMGQGEGHRDAPTLRGNSTTADFFVDGVRDDVQYFRDLYNAERIEVLKGPNALIFGRGGAGGVINRVSRLADGEEIRTLTLQAGSNDNRRATIDLGDALDEIVSARLLAVYENSGSYRNHVETERYGINPTASFNFSEQTRVQVSFEHFTDKRTVDRGVPSQNGRPLEISASAYFGNPDLSRSDVGVNLLRGTIEHAFSPTLSLKNHTVIAGYDKAYSNVHANSSVNGLGNVSLQAYNSTTDRLNMFNQTDLVWDTSTGGIRHKILFGVEFGWQDTDNTRAPNNNAAGVVNILNPTTFAPVAFVSPLQADNNVGLTLAAAYLQDQIDITDSIKVVAGLRVDRFDLEFNDLRPANADFSRADTLVSPRLGVIYKPLETMSVYGSYAVSHLPQSGDQFASLDATTASLDPEKFLNLEVGFKWDIKPSLAFTAALYRLDRSNTRAVDPITSLTVLTGEQRSEGLELGLSGNLTNEWSVMAGYALQDAEITKTTTAAPAGRVVPLVPEQTFSLWNHYRLSKEWAAAVGVTHQTDMFASISNAVVLPAYTRVDAAVYYRISDEVKMQVNVENVLDETYWGTAHNDNNITPGAPRSVRVTMTSMF